MSDYFTTAKRPNKPRLFSDNFEDLERRAVFLPIGRTRPEQSGGYYVKGLPPQNVFATPQFLVDMVKAAELPGRVAAGENIPLSDITKMAMDTMGGSALLSRGVPAAALGLNVAGRKPKSRKTKKSQLPAYPKVAPPEKAIDKTSGKEYLAKVLSPEAKEVQKAVKAAQKDIDAGNYTPMFPTGERFDVDFANYGKSAETVDVARPKTPAKQEEWADKASDPESVKRLKEAYEQGLKIKDADNWYYMGQLEQAFIDEFGEKVGRQLFKEKFADSMAATTGGAAPKENLRMAMYGNYLREQGLPYPTAAYEMPFPIGGRYAMGNINQHQKLMGTAMDPTKNPKRYNFSNNFLGDRSAATIDEQMSNLFDPKLNQPQWYGSYEGVVADLAKKYGTDPRGFQDVSWAGGKYLKNPEKYPGSRPMIEEVNQAIERTARVTGMSPEDVLKQGIMRSNIPIYSNPYTGMAPYMMQYANDD